MTTLLVVHDSEFDRGPIDNVLRVLGDWSTKASWSVEYVSSGAEALASLGNQQFNLLLTDLHLPAMSGMDLLAKVREQHLHFPVVIMAGRGSEEMTIQALRHGATNYVMKKNILNDLPRIIESVMQAHNVAQEESQLLTHLMQMEYQFEIPNELPLVLASVAYIQNSIRRAGRLAESEVTRLGIALDEALRNAIIHGNLEVSSKLREEESDAYERLIDYRSKKSPFQDRAVRITVRIEEERFVCKIKDQGPGFRLSDVPDPTDPANLERPSGRGLLLIRSFVDDVQHNAIGNEITLTKELNVPTDPDQSSPELSLHDCVAFQLDDVSTSC